LNAALEKVTSEHLEDNCHLDFSRNKLSNFSVEWFDYIDIPKLSLDFSYNVISTIFGVSKKQYSDGYLSRMERRIDLSHNLLKYFPVRLLIMSPKITHLNLSSNRIQSVRLLKKLKNPYSIQFLDLSFNHIRNFSFPDFGNLTVADLNLSHNHIEIIPESESKNFTYQRFVVIDLSYNKLKHLPIQLFQGITAERVSLFQNFITEFVNYEDPIESMIKYLDISHNKIRTLSIKALSKLQADTLDLSFNRIHEIHEFEEIKRIKTLILEHNHITTIPFEAFAKSTIKHLLLKDNRIYLRHGIFPNNVEYLDLRGNYFGHLIQEDHFLFYKNLTILRLENCDISTNFLTDDFKSSSIKKLGIARNPFYCESLKDLLKILHAGNVDYQIEAHEDFGIHKYSHPEFEIPVEETLVHDRPNINGIECIE
jgi:Leucine-rich repeat (LRR) protein